MKPLGNITRPYMGWWIDAAGLVACLVISITSYALGVAPLVQRSADIQDALQERQRQEQEKADLARSHNQLKQRLQDTQKELNEAAFQLQPISRLNEYLVKLTNLATQSGLSLHEIKSGKPITLKHYRSIPLRLSGTSTYQNSVSFLYRLNKEFPDIRVSALNLRVLTNSGKPQVKVSMDLIWHTALASNFNRQ